MKSIYTYSDLIKNIPVRKQSSYTKKDSWNRIIDEHFQAILTTMFGSNDKIEISRQDVFNENDVYKKIVKTFIWGYPTVGRGNNIQNVINSEDRIVGIMSSINGKKITKNEYFALVTKLKKITGLGISTWTKMLYFFDVKIENSTCQIFDNQIFESLNKEQLIEFMGNKYLRHNYETYLNYIDDLAVIAKEMMTKAENIEVFLFYFNNRYKL